MKKLPLGITTFEDIRDPAENYLYVDKTHIARQLAENGKYYFLSRPRRFGKSLFLDTLSDLFQARQPLFAELSIYQTWDWSSSYPVIKLDMSADYHSYDSGIASIFAILDDIKATFQVTCKNNTQIYACFAELIKNISNKYQQKVVILIDEYDKPILDNIENKALSTKLRDVLKTFYSVIKSHDKYLKFVFITGVSKFSKMNLFSGLNNLTDITTMPAYADICGYTHDDIKTTFKEHLVDVELDKLKQWYNGYNYLGGEARQVYNPYDILLFINNDCEYENYWWTTGNPSFLIKKLQEQNYYIPDLENIIVSKQVLDVFDIEKIDLIALLWQTGYLTFAKKITRRDKVFFQLKVPNKEIQLSLNDLFISYLTDQTVEAIKQQDYIFGAIDGDISSLETVLISLFASIPYNNYANKVIERYEGYYASVVFTYLMSLGFPCVAEDVTNKGRIDLTIKLPNRILIIEFKVDQHEAALAQIKQQKYYDKYITEAKAKSQEIIIVGICFDSKDKNITEFEWEKIC